MDEPFAYAVKIVQSFVKFRISPTYDQKLSLFALFKQATEGPAPAQGARPAVTAVVERAKYDAWKSIGHLSDTDAKRAYVQHVLRILRDSQDHPEAVSSMNQLMQLLPANEAHLQATETGEDTLAPLPSSTRHSNASTSLVAAVRSQNAKLNRKAQIIGHAKYEDDGSSAEDASDSAEEHPSNRYSQQQKNEPSPIPSNNLQRAASPASSLGPYQQEWLERQQRQTQWEQQQSGSNPYSTYNGLRSPIYGSALTSPYAPPLARRSSDDAPVIRNLTQLSQTPTTPLRPESSASQQVYSPNLQPSYQPLRSPVLRPPTRGSANGSVPLETTLQAIHTSLNMLHDRISALERARLATRRQTSLFSVISDSVKGVVRVLPWPFGSKSNRSQSLSLRTNDSSLATAIWSSMRDVSFLAVAVTLILRWKRGYSMADLWTGWLHFIRPNRSVRGRGNGSGSGSV